MPMQHTESSGEPGKCVHDVSWAGREIGGHLHVW